MMRSKALALGALALLAALTGAPSCDTSAGQVDFGPYVQWPAAGAFTVSWRTKSPGTTFVEYGLTTAYGLTKSVPGTAYQHHARLEGLLANTAYFYRATSKNASGQVIFQKTGGPVWTAPAGAATFKFAAIGEPHQKPSLPAWAVILSDPAIRLLADASDTVDNGTLGDYKQFFDFVAPYAKRLLWLPAVGNHSYPSDPGLANYLDITDLPGNGRWWTVRYGHVQFVSLNSVYEADAGAGTTQLSWLAATLAAATDGADDPMFVVAITHYPAWSSGIPYHEAQRAWVRAKFVPLFEQYDVDLVIHGHDGIYERSQKNGVVYIQVSSGLFDPQYAWNQTPNPQQVVVVPYILSALVVEATPGALQFKAYSPWAQVLDEGTILP